MSLGWVWCGVASLDRGGSGQVRLGLGQSGLGLRLGWVSFGSDNNIFISFQLVSDYP